MSPRRSLARRAESRPGMTLVEIMIVLVLLGLVGGVIMRVITRQQRFYHGVNQIMSERSQIRQAVSVLPIDLRSVSSVGGDIEGATDSEMDIWVHIASSVVCQVIDGSHVALPPLTLASGQTLTAYTETPSASRGDRVVIYNDSSSAGNHDDRWQQFALLGGPGANVAACVPPAFTTLADALQPRWVLELGGYGADLGTDAATGGPISQYIGVGAPVRVLRRVKYALFKDTDDKWYLGYAQWNGGGWDTMYRVSGPYDPYVSSGASGITFKYYDVNGAEIASGSGAAELARIARVDLVVRGRTEHDVRTEGIQGGVRQQYRDSLAISVMLRNRS